MSGLDLSGHSKQHVGAGRAGLELILVWCSCWERGPLVPLMSIRSNCHRTCVDQGSTGQRPLGHAGRSKSSTNHKHEQWNGCHTLTEALLRIADGRYAPSNRDFQDALKDCGLDLKALFDLHAWHDPHADSTHCGLAFSVMQALWHRHTDQVGLTTV